MGTVFYGRRDSVSLAAREMSSSFEAKHLITVHRYDRLLEGTSPSRHDE
jgi:hypothetical protein